MKTLISLALLLCGSTLVSAQNGPFDSISGNWTNDIKMSMKNSAQTESDIFWVGRIFGQINSTGKIKFTSENGCQMIGIVEPYYGMFNHEINITGCRQSDLNGIYSGYVSLTSKMLKFSGTSAKILVGGNIQRSFSTTMTRY